MNIDRQKYKVYNWIVTYNPNGYYTELAWIYNHTEILFLMYDEYNFPMKRNNGGILSYFIARLKDGNF